jgi:zinc/manganese transport system permease protein
MLGAEFMRNALLAGTAIAIACGVSGWFVVLRGQVFAGDALGHVAFPGALAAAAAGIDARIGLFAATVAAGAAIGLLGRGALAAHGAGAGSAAAAQDAAIGTVFTAILGTGVFFLTLLGNSGGGAAGIEGARTLFGSVFGLGAGEARLAAALAAAAALLVAAMARPLLFASLLPDVAAARGVRTRLLALAFAALLGVVAAEATQAVGALLLLGLLAAPAAAAQRLTAAPLAGIALAAGLATASMWGGLALAFELSWLPPSSAILLIAVALYAAALLRRA